MTDMRNISKRFISEFIDLYRQNTCLWQLKCPDYTNKKKRTLAYAQLTKKLNEIEPDCTKEHTIRKINSLRTCFRKENRKVAASMKSGCKPDGVVYQPSLWYYDLMKFLVDDQDIPEVPQKVMLTVNGELVTTLGKEEKNVIDINFERANQNDINGTEHEIIEDIQLSTDPENDSEITHSTTLHSSKLRSSKHHHSTAAKRSRKVDRVLDIVAENLEMNDPVPLEYDNFGKHIAEQMRKLPKRQNIFVSKIISDALYEAQLGNLSNRSRLVNVTDPNEIIVMQES